MSIKIYKQLADTHYQLADLYEQLAAEEAIGDDSAAPVQTGRGAGGGLSPQPDTFSDGYPIEEPPTEFADALPRQQEAVLSECPVHFKPWTVKEGGISKNGKPYSAFWKCNGKNQDGSYCSKKPTPAWVKSHPPENALVAA